MEPLTKFFGATLDSNKLAKNKDQIRQDIAGWVAHHFAKNSPLRFAVTVVVHSVEPVNFRSRKAEDKAILREVKDSWINEGLKPKSSHRVNVQVAEARGRAFNRLVRRLNAKGMEKLATYHVTLEHIGALGQTSRAQVIVVLDYTTNEAFAVSNLM